MVFLFSMFVVVVIAITFFALVKTFAPEDPKNKDSYNWTTEWIYYSLKIKPFVFLGILGVIVIVGICSAIYRTTEQQIGFVSTFGKNTTIDAAGIHFKIPFVSQKYVYTATTQGMPIGYVDTDVDGDEESVYEDSLMITSDFNFINIDFYLEYRISNAIDYHYCTDQPEEILRNIAQASIRNTVGQYDIDSVMTTGKSQIELDIFEDILLELSNHNTGLTVTSIIIQDVEPPTAAVQAAFKAVEDAKQGAETAVNEANEYTNTELPAAEANAAKVLQSATATQTERINAAKQEVATFEALFSEYTRNPEIVKQRMYLEAVSDLLPNMKIIVGKDAKVINVSGNSIAIN